MHNFWLFDLLDKANEIKINITAVSSIEILAIFILLEERIQQFMIIILFLSNVLHNYFNPPFKEKCRFNDACVRSWSYQAKFLNRSVNWSLVLSMIICMYMYVCIYALAVVERSTGDCFKSLQWFIYLQQRNEAEKKKCHSKPRKYIPRSCVACIEWIFVSRFVEKSLY